MRIGIDCRELRDGAVTGIGRFLLNFLHCAPVLRPGWSFVLFSDAGTPPVSTGGGVSYVRLSAGNTQFWEQVRLPVALRREHCDLFFSPYYKTCLFPGMPSVITVHDMTEFVYPGYLKHPGLYSRLMRLYAGSSTVVMTVSENSKNDICRFLGIAPGKVSVVPNAVDAAFCRQGDPAARLNALGLNGHYMLYVGNSRPHKNVEGLVKAFSLMSPKARAGRNLVLAGVGNYAVPPGIAGSYPVVIPRVAEEDLPLLYWGADLFIFPSFYEGFGIPPLEAMACGCPVAASNTSSLPEVLGDACIYFNPHEPGDIAAAMAAALGDKTLRPELVRKGLARAALYSSERSAAAILGVLESALKAAVEEN